MIYSDIDINLALNPITGDVVVKKDVQAVKQAVRLLLNTCFYDRLFNPQIGSRLRELLFDTLDSFNIELIKSELTDLFKSYEPRVKLINIEAKLNEDQAKVSIKIEYYILSLGKKDTFIYTINRLR